ncbi:phospholipase D-like domain-containing protein [Paenibacillaceae sp. P-4]|uniref:phospholipase D-like domain-containing protein n=1 Tax=Paenibacillaceae bacterium P-4 TaxID=3160969 RepID=UPI0032E830A1
MWDFEGGKFVSSKDEYGFKSVVEDFKNAKKIRIVTFNISSKKEDPLLQAIKSLNIDTNIEIITNIPSRAESYYNGEKGRKWRSTASTNINTYLAKLNPDTFNGPIVPFFNFNNHSKIIGTENIVYIGSANYSVESKNNYEAGILIEDKQFIKKLYEIFFEYLKENSVPYFNDNYNQLRLFIISILTRLVNHYENFMDSFFYIRKNEEAIFINDETKFSQNDLFVMLHDLQELTDIQGLIENIDSVEDEVSSALEQMYDILDNMPINDTVDLLAIDGPIYDYITFDIQQKTNDIFESEYSAMADDGEKLEYYLDISSDNASDILSDICNDAEIDIYYVKRNLEDIIQSLKYVDIIIKEISKHTVNPIIDNT